MKNLFLSLFMVLGCAFGVMAQTAVTVNVVVTDQNQQPLPNTFVALEFDLCMGIDSAGNTTDSLGTATFDFTSCSQGMFTAYVYCAGTGSVEMITGSWNPTQTTVTVFAVCSAGTGNPCTTSWASSDSAGYTYFFPILQGGTAPYTYLWDFGNGMTSTVAWPIVQYNAPGSYIACLTVTDDNGITCSYCDSVVITSACNIDITVYGDSLFTADVTGITGSLTYYWDFGDNTSSTDASPMHYYANPGSYTACLTVTDATTGLTCTACTMITIPTSNPCNGYAALDVDSTGSAILWVELFNVPGTVIWDLGDGTFANGIQVSHTYPNPGVYTACALVNYWMTGDTCEYCVTFTVGNPCNGSITASPDTGTANAFQFNSIIPAPASVAYFWDFGDNNLSTVANPFHIYANAGTYQVCLTTMDAAGNQCTYCTSVTVAGNPINSISGMLSTNNAPADYGVVYLIEYDSLNGGTLTMIDSVETDSGYYHFYDIADGSYLLKGALTSNSSSYAGFVPTYYVNSLIWSSGVTVHTFGGVTYLADINLIAGLNPGGPGFVGGLVSQGANFAGPGDPIAGVQVVLMDLDGNAVAYTYSDSDGLFSFDNIAYGTYKVHAEVLGKPTTAGEVTVSAANPTTNNVSVEVNSDYVVTFVTSVGVNGPELISSVKVLGNPIQDELILSLDLDVEGEIAIRVLDLLGRTTEFVQVNAGESQVTIPMHDAAEGLYIVELIIEGQSVGALKVMK